MEEWCNKYHGVIIKKLGTKLKRIADPRQKGKLLSIGDIIADVYVRAPVVDHSTARLEALDQRDVRAIFALTAIRRNSDTIIPSVGSKATRRLYLGGYISY